MKNLFILLLLLSPTLNAQNTFQKEMLSEKSFTIADILPLENGDYMLCGSVRSEEADSTNALVMRLDSLLEVKWSKRYNLLRMDYFKTIAATSDGNFLVGGSSRKNFSEYYGANLFKIDPEGNIIWHKLYVDSYDDVTQAIYEQSDNSLVLFIRYGVNGRPSKLVKTDSLGNVLHEITLDKDAYNSGLMAEYVISNANGEYFMGGTALSKESNTRLFYLLKTNDVSDLWYKEYYFERASSYLYSMSFLDDGNIVLAGIVADSLDSQSNAALLKIDPSDGNPIWAKEYRQENDFIEAAYRVGSLKNNEIMLSGIANTNLGTQGLAMRLDENGDILWSKEYGTGSYEVINFETELSMGRYLFSGYMQYNHRPYFVVANNNGSSCISGNLMLTARELRTSVYTDEIIHNDPDIVEVSPAITQAELSISQETFCTDTISRAFNKALKLELYPNPASTYININLESVAAYNYSYQIFDTRGLRVQAGSIKNNLDNIQLNIHPGIYVIALYNEKGIVLAHEKLIIE